MSNLILPAVSKLPPSAGGDPVSVFALIVMAGVYIGVFAPILWRQFKAAKAA